MVAATPILVRTPVSDVIDNRMTFGDDAYFLGEQVLGVPLTSQHTWWLDEPLSAAQLGLMHDRMLAGPMSRLVAPATVPQARSRWVPAPVVDHLRVDTDVVQTRYVMRWFDDRLRDHLDPVRGPGWRLAAAPVSDGSQLVSFTTRHCIGDGSLIVRSIEAAVTGAAVPCLPDDTAGAHAVRTRDDLGDARRQLAAAGRAIGRAVRTARAQRKARIAAPEAPAHEAVQTPLRSKPTLPMRGIPGSDYIPPFCVVDLSVADWQQAAATRGGTANSLLMAFSAGLMVASGRVPSGSTVSVVLPTTRRGPDDWRSNVLGSASVPVHCTDKMYADLGPVRAASKAEFTRAADPQRADVGQQLEPLLRVLPHWLLKRVAERMPAALVTCSNVGRMKPPLTGLGGPPARSMMCRGVHRNVTQELMQSAGGGVTTWLQEFGDRMTLTVESLQPDLIGDNGSLADWCCSSVSGGA